MSLCYSIVKMMEDLQSNVVFIALCFKQMSLQNLVDGIYELMKYFKKKKRTLYPTWDNKMVESILSLKIEQGKYSH